MTNTREAKKQRTRDRLLAAARDLFETQGYAATTIDDIAAAAGTTRATLYSHFASKAGLLAQLVKSIDEYFATADRPTLEQAVRSGDPAVIRAWLDKRFDQWVRIRPSLAMIKQSDVDPEITAMVDDWHDEVIARMRSQLDAAERFDASSRTIRCTIAFGTLEALSRRFLRAGGWERFDRDAALDALAASWTHLLADPS